MKNVFIIISHIRGLRQKGYKFKDSLLYTVKPCQKKKIHRRKETSANCLKLPCVHQINTNLLKPTANA